LVDALPDVEASAASSDDEELVELAGFATSSEADMVKELLEQNGIGVIVRGEVDPIGATSGAEPTTLLVEQRDLQRARELYEAYFAGDEAAIETSFGDEQ
jgi:hypothetical protein